MNLLRQITAVGLISVMFAPRGFGQSFELKHSSLFNLQAVPIPGGSANAPRVRKLRIVPLEGEGARNIITARSPAVVAVTVLDENDRPVEGVSVTFQLPASGPSGVFGNQKLTLTAVTDSRGQAGSLDFLPNDKPGRFVINISAKYQEIAATGLMHQTNYFTAEERSKSEAKPFTRTWKFYAILGAAAAAGTVAAVLLTRSGPGPVTVTAGPVSIGGR